MFLRSSWWKDSLFLTLTLALFFFILLGTRPLFTPDEGRYAEIAREMLVSKDYITPHLNGIKYFEKPILFYWLGALAFKIGHINLWAIRSVNALLGLLGCLLTYFTVRKLYDRATGLLAAFILGTSTLYFVMVHMVSLDLPVTVFLAATLYALLLGLEEPPGKIRRYYFWAASVAAALAVLTKGLIGIVFPLIILSSWIILLNEWRQLKYLYLLSCILIFLMITVPWHLLVQLRNAEFGYYYFIEQQFLRYTTEGVGHYQPAWFFIPVLFLGFFPWIVFLPQALIKNFSWRHRQQYKKELFLMLWSALIFVFFSFSHSKLIPYILPVFPPLAILVGVSLARHCEEGVARRSNPVTGLLLGCFVGLRPPRNDGKSFILLPFLSLIIAYIFYSYLQNAKLPDIITAKHYLYTAAIILVTGMSIACLLSYKNVRHAFTTIITTMGIFLVLLNAAMPSVDTRTILPLANLIKPILKPGQEVIAFNQYYQDLPFYLGQRVSIVNWQNELAYGMNHQDTSEWMINNATFWQRWHNKKDLVVILGQEEYNKLRKKHPHEKFYLVGKTVTNVAISNKPLDLLSH